MSVNIRCAGGIVNWEVVDDLTADGDTDEERYAAEVFASSKPCGWCGERYAMGKLTPNQERELRPFSPEWFRACADADRHAQTAKPCPRCGGQVELIPEEVEP